MKIEKNRARKERNQRTMGIENMQYGYNQQAFQVDPELEKISQKNWLDIQKQTEIENIKNRAQADREWQKMCYREARKENELAQHEEVIVDAKGDIYCITRNLNIRAEKRETFNFKVLNPIKVVSSDGDTGVWIFKFIVDGVERSCVMAEKYIFDVKYVTRKLGCCGCRIYATSPRKKKEYIEQLMSRLMESSTRTLEVKTHLGWTKEKTGKFTFVEEEERLWKFFLKKAK